MSEYTTLAILLDGPEGEAILTTNILRKWDRATIERFALHLLGDEWQTLREERDALRNEVKQLQNKLEISRRSLRTVKELIRPETSELDLMEAARDINQALKETV